MSVSVSVSVSVPWNLNYIEHWTRNANRFTQLQECASLLTMSSYIIGGE